MQVNLKLDSVFSAKSLAGTAMSLETASNGVKSPRTERLVAKATCQDPKCHYPEVVLSTYNTTTVIEDGKEIRICCVCQRRRTAELRATAELLSAPVSQINLMTASRKAAQLIGHHPTTGRKTKSLP